MSAYCVPLCPGPWEPPNLRTNPRGTFGGGGRGGRAGRWQAGGTGSGVEVSEAGCWGQPGARVSPRSPPVVSIQQAAGLPGVAMRCRAQAWVGRGQANRLQYVPASWSWTLGWHSGP